MNNLPLRKELHEENRLSWNEATKAHNSHKGEQAKFFREGGSTLFPEEIELLGNISGLSLAHLQCNAGQDTLSLAKLGVEVTGVDISNEAINFALKLSVDSGISANFYCADVFDWLEATANQSKKFDVVFSSYGGRFVLMEFHPVAMIFDDDWSHKFPYFRNGEPLTCEDGISDYVANSGVGLIPDNYQVGIENFCNPYRSHEFQWGIGEIITVLLQAGLTLEVLKEYPYSNGCKLFDNMREETGRRTYPPENIPNVPLMYGVVARKG